MCSDGRSVGSEASSTFTVTSSSLCMTVGEGKTAFVTKDPIAAIHLQ